MDTQTIDQEFGKLQTEFQDVAGSVKTLADKLKAAAASGDANAGAWLTDLEQVAKDIDDEQDQAHALLLSIHGFISDAASSAAASQSEHPPLYAPGQEPDPSDQQQPQPQRRGMFGGMFGGGMMGGGVMGGGMMGGGMMGGGMMGYGGGGFAQAMEMGAGMSIGANLIGSIFRR